MFTKFAVVAFAPAGDEVQIFVLGDLPNEEKAWEEIERLRAADQPSRLGKIIVSYADGEDPIEVARPTIIDALASTNERFAAIKKKAMAHLN